MMNDVTVSRTYIVRTYHEGAYTETEDSNLRNAMTLAKKVKGHVWLRTTTSNGNGPYEMSSVKIREDFTK